MSEAVGQWRRRREREKEKNHMDNALSSKKIYDICILTHNTVASKQASMYT